jgi:hypothetical protein
VWSAAAAADDAMTKIAASGGFTYGTMESAVLVQNHVLSLDRREKATLIGFFGRSIPPSKALLCKNIDTYFA